MKSQRILKHILPALFLVAFLLGNCSESGASKSTNNTLLLYLVNNTASEVSARQKCIYAYGLANSCVAGSLQQFNAGIGCSSQNVRGAVAVTPATNPATTFDPYDALIFCLNARINNPVNPCNLPQNKPAYASQAIGGVFRDCNSATFSFTPSGVTTAQTVDLSNMLRF